MTSDVLLMHEDTAACRMNFDTGLYDVITEPLLPYSLKGRLQKVTNRLNLIMPVTEALSLLPTVELAEEITNALLSVYK